jgi:NCS1 family nucleobase:cation symporter-1
MIATLTTNIAANMVAPANGLSNISPKRISYKTGILITGLAAVGMMPWKLLETAGAYIFGWLGTYGIMLGPLAGIYIADYYIVKKRNIDVMALFSAEKGRYWYSGGFNSKAFIAWIAGAALPVIGKLVPAAKTLADNGYIISFVVAMVVYILIMKSETTSFVSDEEEEAMTQR